MSRRDTIHNAVKNALIKDGWKITHDPFYVAIEEDNKEFEVDLGGEKLLGAEKDLKKIAVEIKSFNSTSVINSFHTALGQYLDYRDAMEEGNYNRILFLAVNSSSYKKIENLKFIKRQIERYTIKIIVIDTIKETIILWKN